MSTGKYIEHTNISSDEFSVVDASTIGGNRPHDEFVWVSIGTDGRWLSPDQAELFAQAITKVVAAHRVRRRSVAQD